MICKLKGIKVRIYIPTENCIDKIDLTMDSIRKLDYPKKDIEVMIIDFNSTDGTYEKLLEYQDAQVGIYRLNKKLNIRNQYECYEQITLNHGYDNNCVHMGIKPGDVLYPDSIKYINDIFSQVDNPLIKGIICEVDRALPSSNSCSQVPLFKKPFILSAKENKEYLVRGFNHKVLSLNREGFINSGDFSRFFYNDWNNWNYKFFRYYQNQCLYLPNPVALVQEEAWEDEFEICLLFHACLLGSFRTFEGREYSIKEEIQNKAFVNAAYHSIWRSFCALDKNKQREAKQSLWYSTILYPDIRKDKAFLYMKDLIEKNIGVDYKTLLEKLPLDTSEDVPDTVIPLDID